MRSFSTAHSRVFCLMFGLLSIFSLTTHAGSPAPQKSMKLPKLISGEFTYHEFIKSNKGGEAIEDESRVVVEIDFALSVHDPFDQMAIYFLDNAGFSAKANAKFVTVSQGCTYTTTYTRSGGGIMDPPGPNPYAPAPNPATLTWFIKDKRFALHFQTPIEKGQVTMNTNVSCSNVEAEPVTSQYVWACDLEGAVDYNAKTKTYRFVLLEKYTVPYRERQELRSDVFVIGELSGKL